MTYYNTFIKSKGMSEDNGTAWFVDKEENILYKMDINTGICQYISTIPLEENVSTSYGQNPECIKIGEKVYCIPVLGKRIWIYDLKYKEFTEIEINNPDNRAPCMWNYWEHDEKLWILSCGLKQIVEVNINEGKIENYYDIVKDDGFKIGNRALKTQGHIFLVSQTNNQIGEFNLCTKKISYYKVPMMETGISTIYYDGKEFWLSGYTKDIYIWNKDKQETRKIGEVPLGFIFDNTDINRYDMPVFNACVGCGSYVWFLPYNWPAVRCSGILYLHVETKEVKQFAFYNMNDEFDSVFLEYMRGDVLGLYMLSKRCIIEINAINMNIKYKQMLIDEKCLYDIEYNRMQSKLESSCVKNEKHNYDLSFLVDNCKIMRREGKEGRDNIGAVIMEHLVNSAGVEGRI